MCTKSVDPLLKGHRSDKMSEKSECALSTTTQWPTEWRRWLAAVATRCTFLSTKQTESKQN